MVSRRTTLFAAVSSLLALWVAWGAYVTRTTERVPYETLERFDGVELRRYPRTVLVETTASDERTAFQRLFRYLSGANERRESVSMTAPVATRGETLAMTAPVRTDRGGERPVTTSVRGRRDGDGDTVTMAFYLPAEYAPETAPTPTDPSVRLVVEPPRMAAVRAFSWYATSGRVEREGARLLETLAEHDIAVRGEPVVLQYNDPWTPPFMRHNEVEVPVSPEAT